MARVEDAPTSLCQSTERATEKLNQCQNSVSADVRNSATRHFCPKIRLIADAQFASHARWTWLTLTLDRNDARKNDLEFRARAVRLLFLASSFYDCGESQGGFNGRSCD